MKETRVMLLTALLSGVTACASAPSPDPVAAQAAAEAEARAAALQAAELEQQAERARQMAEQRAREAAEADRRYLEMEAQLREEEQARRRARVASGSQREAPGAAPALSQGTQEQARIAELRARIAANKAETSGIDSANAVLREAIAAAELLMAALAAEQQKDGLATPAAGQADGVSNTEIEELAAEVARLRALAAELGAADAAP